MLSIQITVTVSNTRWWWLIAFLLQLRISIQGTLTNPAQNSVCSRVGVCIPLHSAQAALYVGPGKRQMLLRASSFCSALTLTLTEVFNLFHWLCNPAWQYFVFSWRASAAPSPANLCWSPQLFLLTASEWHHETRDHLLAVASRAAHLVSCAFMLLAASFFCCWMVTQVLFWLATLQIVEEINMKLFTFDFNRKTGGIVFQIFLLWTKCVLDTSRVTEHFRDKYTQKENSTCWMSWIIEQWRGKKHYKVAKQVSHLDIYILHHILLI